MDTWQIIDNERTSLADLADSLTPEQWNQSSLCTAWKVRDVVAHVAEGSSIKFGQAFVALVKHGFRLNRMLEQEAIKGGKEPIEDLRKQLRDAIGMRNCPPGVKPEGLLLDQVVHEQDIRRPLGVPRTVPADALKATLDTVVKQKTSILPGKKRSADIHLRATDLDWEHGEGLEVTGPGEAILMALSGRAAAVADLSGPGVETLRARVGD
jgi:uncharacterized protein (TIGR03083 family)